MESAAMTEVALWGFAVKAVYAVAAVLILLGLLRLVNKLSGNQFDAWWKNASSWDRGIYYSTRYFSLCYLVGSIIS